MWARKGFFLIILCLLLAEPGWSRVFIYWTEPSIPPAQTLGVHDVVINWGSHPPGLMKTARSQGYRVFAEVSSQQAKAAAEVAATEGLAGIIVKASGSSPSPEVNNSLIQALRSSYPRLSVLLLEPGGKQPQLRGTTVVSRRGFLAVSSPTRQPWIDSNVALIRYERVYNSSQEPLFDYAWELTGALEERLGPRTEDYALAVAEAGTFHADLILNLHRHLQQELIKGSAEGLKTWKQIKTYIDFYSGNSGAKARPVANIGVVTGDYDTAYEEMNLLARRNIPFRVVTPQELAAGRLEGLDLIVVFSPLDAAATRVVSDFASKGGTVVLAGQEGQFPWRAEKPIQKNENAVTYRWEKGRVVELSTPIVNPDAFAEDIRRLLPPQQQLVGLWNALTVVSAVYRQAEKPGVTVDLVNFAEEPLRVQVRLKGDFSSARYATPERGCCVTLPLSHANGFTQFVVPWLRIGGSVHLEATP